MSGSATQSNDRYGGKQRNGFTHDAIVLVDIHEQIADLYYFPLK